MPHYSDYRAGVVPWHRRLARATLSGIGAALLVTGCQRADASDVVTLRFWAFGREGEVVQELMRDFERQNPGIRVHVQQIPWTAAHEKLLTAYVGDATPDVAQLGNTWIPEFVALNALARGRPAAVLRRHLGDEHRRRAPLRDSLVRGHARPLLPQRPARRRRLPRGAPHVGCVAGGDAQDQGATRGEPLPDPAPHQRVAAARDPRHAGRLAAAPGRRALRRLQRLDLPA